MRRGTLGTGRSLPDLAQDVIVQQLRGGRERAAADGDQTVGLDVDLKRDRHDLDRAGKAVLAVDEVRRPQRQTKPAKSITTTLP